MILYYKHIKKYNTFFYEKTILYIIEHSDYLTYFFTFIKLNCIIIKKVLLYSFKIYMHDIISY